MQQNKAYQNGWFVRWFVDAVQKSTADWQIVVMPGHSLSGKPSLLDHGGWILKEGDKIEKLSHSWVEFALSLCDDCTYNVLIFPLLQQTFDIFIRNLMFSKWGPGSIPFLLFY